MIDVTGLILVEIFAKEARPGAHVHAPELPNGLRVTPPLLLAMRQLVEYHNDPDTKLARDLAEMIKANPGAQLTVVAPKVGTLEAIEPDADAPCPFCGCKSAFLTSDDHALYYIECNDCQAQGPRRHTAKDADAIWRKRDQRNG